MPFDDYSISILFSEVNCLCMFRQSALWGTFVRNNFEFDSVKDVVK